MLDGAMVGNHMTSLLVSMIQIGDIVNPLVSEFKEFGLGTEQLNLDSLHTKLLTVQNLVQETQEQSAEIVGLFVFDFAVVIRKPHEPSFKESALWSLFYIAVAIEVASCDPLPPAEVSCEAGFYGGFDKFAFVIEEHFYWSPFAADEEVDPAITIGVGPEGTTDEARLLQSLHRGRLVGEPCASWCGVIAEEATGGSFRIGSRDDPSAHEQVEVAVAIVVRAHHTTPAVTQIGQGRGGVGETTGSVVEIESVPQEL